MENELIKVKKRYGYKIYSEGKNGYGENILSPIGKIVYSEELDQYAYRKAWNVWNIGEGPLREIVKLIESMNKKK